MSAQQPDRISAESAQNRRLLQSQFWRRPVVVKADPDGHLRPTGMPPPIERAGDEERLDRDLAALVEADPAEVAAFAGRFGLLRAPPSSAGIDALEAQLPVAGLEFIHQVRDQLPRLRHWIATGGSTQLAGALVPLAAIVLIVADLGDQRIETATRWLAGDEPDPLKQADLLEGVMSALDHGMETGGTVMRLTGLPEAMLRPANPESARRLRPAARLIEAALIAVDRGAPSAALPPGWLRLLSSMFQGVPAAPAWPLMSTETVDQWREAARELRLWDEACRSLRAGRARWESMEGRRAELADHLWQRAALVSLPPPGRARLSLGDAEAFRSSLVAVLSHRLKQEAAWPHPSNGVVVPVLARALWVVWRRIGGPSASRICGWDQCGELLPPGTHGNRRYCAMHREVARAHAGRARAARSYARHRETARR